MRQIAWIVCMMGSLASMANANPRILVIGDSLTEGYGVEPDEAYPALLQKLLRSHGKPQAEVINAGTSGATSAFGLRTLRFQSKHQKPDYLLLALGANDALRGLPTASTEKNLAAVITEAQSLGIKTILLGMLAPPNQGATFVKDFAAIYDKLATTYQIKLVPFLLEGVAAKSQYNQPDGIHPNPKGYELIAQNIFNQLKDDLK